MNPGWSSRIGRILSGMVLESSLTFPGLVMTATTRVNIVILLFGTIGSGGVRHNLSSIESMVNYQKMVADTGRLRCSITVCGSSAEQRGLSRGQFVHVAKDTTSVREQQLPDFTEHRNLT